MRFFRICIALYLHIDLYIKYTGIHWELAMQCLSSERPFKTDCAGQMSRLG